MFERMKKFLFGDNREVARVVENPVLGRLQFSDDEETWFTDSSANSDGIRFNIAGDWNDGLVRIEPAPVLVEQAMAIATDMPGLKLRVEDFLRAEVGRNAALERWRDEILALKISVVCLFWPERPFDGEIQFKSPDRAGERVWACAYVNGEPAPTLGFSG